VQEKDLDPKNPDLIIKTANTYLTASHNLNEHSSRGHVCLTLIIDNYDKISILDLAANENTKTAGTEGIDLI
jgi:hypothetical protein